MTHSFRQVDVFGSGPCTGNPVAVVLDAEGIDEETMRTFSIWSNLSECTFVLPPTDPGADYRVRIFALGTELPFAGHPTLGTARAWLDAGGVPREEGLVVQECAAGLIPVRIEDEVLAFGAPPRIRSGAVEPELLTSVIEILGVDPSCVVDAEWLDNGPGWVGVLLDSAQTVLDLNPDVSGHEGAWKIGVIGAQDADADTDFELRAFFGQESGSMREDPVTGSLNAAAAQWLTVTGRAQAPYRAAQGTAIGRRGRVFISSSDETLWVGGRAEVVLSGTATL
jgi:PhzF family phenazine biosynthesis protein